jgi:hypothetical protein
LPAFAAAVQTGIFDAEKKLGLEIAIESSPAILAVVLDRGSVADLMSFSPHSM